MLGKTARRAWRANRGANLVEMALVTPVLILLVAGAVDFGRAFHNSIVVANASREGAREASRLPCYPANATQRGEFKSKIIEATLAEATNNGVTLSASENISISPSPDVTCPGRGNPITVTVSYGTSTLFAGILGTPTLTVTNRTRMMCYGNDQEAPVVP